MSGKAIGTRLAIAETQAAIARQRLSGSIGALQHRASPATIATAVAETLKTRGTMAFHDAVDGVKQRPATAAAIAGGVVLFLARRPLFALLRRATGTFAASSSRSITSDKGSST